jgi:hypothetical protein
MIAGTAPENETTRLGIHSFDFARITDRSNFPSKESYRKQARNPETRKESKKLVSTEALYTI